MMMPIQVFSAEIMSDQHIDKIIKENEKSNAFIEAIIKAREISDEEAQPLRERIKEKHSKLLAIKKLSQTKRIEILENIHHDAKKRLALITIGMSREEVEGILGEGWSTTIGDFWANGNNQGYALNDYAQHHDFGCIYIWYDWKDIRRSSTRKEGERLYNPSKDQQVIKQPIFTSCLSINKQKEAQRGEVV